MSSDQNNLRGDNIIQALAFSAFLYTRIADEHRMSSLAASRFATEIASARHTIAAEMAKTRHATLLLDFDDTPDATEDDLLNQARRVDDAIRKTLQDASPAAYESIIDGMKAAADRLKSVIHDAGNNAGAWQCCVCQRLLSEKLDECPCGASSAGLRPVWKDENGKWFGCC